ncbi:polysaccharide biosynthesis protein [Spirosoma taeanense]|uniref:Polysaccharide biosynthesis protein n=1 Tax=Spirosoma taeanense TaxID=2735870 RepID=A0A6M5YGG4_9BACT|nr:oligosaccharide flippase family protein [Spirosoma taeanense]QJW92012.1 polysaccharide biosynthesis protein [Spirosoma taeanense]
MSTFKKLASDTALYGISTILGRMLNYVLVPIQTYAFARPKELSSNVEFYSYIALLLVIYTLGLETAFFRFSARKPETTAVVFSNTLSMVIVITTVATVLLLWFAPEIAVWLNYPNQATFIRWSALIVAIDAVMAIPFARLRVENKARQFVVARMLNIAIVVALNVLFLIVCPDILNGKYLSALQPLVRSVYDPSIGPGYIFLANLLGNLCYFVLLRGAFRGFRFRLNWGDIRILYVYAFPIMLTGLANVVNNLTDRLFLRHYLPDDFYPGLTNEDALGIYGNCFKLSVFMALVTTSFRLAADPFFFTRAEDKNAPDLLARVTKWFTIVCVFIWVGVSLNLDILGKIMLAPAYRRGLDVVPLLLLGNLFLGVYQNIAFWFKLTDKTKFGTLITGIGAAITILGNILLIPVMGYMGCAVAFLTSSFVMMAICYGLGRKYYPVPYEVGSAVAYVLGAGLLIYASLWIDIPNLWMAVPFHLVLFGLFTAVIIFLERDSLQPLIARFRQRKPAPAGPTELK